MNRYATLIILLITLFSCEKGNIIPQGDSVSVIREISEGKILLVESAITVEVCNDANQICIVRALENIEPYVFVEKESDTIHIYLKPELDIIGSYTIDVFLAMDGLETFIAKDGAQIILTDSLSVSSI